MKKTIGLSSGRVDAAFIRKSSEEQSEQGQSSNVKAMLDGIGVTVSDDFWFMGTVGRRKVSNNTEFIRLMELVENDQIGTVYIESQDRWGTADRPELFNLLGILRDHNTKLYDLRGKTDLTERDLATEMLAFINSVKSEQELKDISYRSLRTRVNNFKDTGSWPTGPQPFGYGKACHESDGTLLWEWHPVSRTRGQMYYPDVTGKLKASGPTDAKITRKRRGQRIILVPNKNSAFIKSIQFVFDLFTRVGLSRRQISARLNTEGFQFYNGPFTHSLVTQILKNPAYVGDIHFGKTQTGELHTFDEAGEVVPLATNGKRSKIAQVRSSSGQIIKKQTHEALIDRKTWKLAQEKITSEQGRTSFAPRNPAYYLKQILVCGHCGKNMAGRTETQPRSKKKTVVYVCSSYVAGRCGGHEVECGFQRITHENAEQLLIAKIAEHHIQFDELTSVKARLSLQSTLKHLDYEDDIRRIQWHDWLREGVNALIEHLQNSSNFTTGDIKKIGYAARSIYQYGKIIGVRRPPLPLSIAKLKNVIYEAEQKAVTKANHMVAELSKEHEVMTLAWAKASVRQQSILKEEIDRIELELQKWESQIIPISERFQKIIADESEGQAERDLILKELPTLDSREKGEAFRRLFNKVILFWDRTFIPASTTPSRPRTTNRSGRNRFTLRKDLIEWDYADLHLASSW